MDGVGAVARDEVLAGGGQLQLLEQGDARQVGVRVGDAEFDFERVVMVVGVHEAVVQQKVGVGALAVENGDGLAGG